MAFWGDARPTAMASTMQNLHTYGIISHEPYLLHNHKTLASCGQTILIRKTTTQTSSRPPYVAMAFLSPALLPRRCLPRCPRCSPPARARRAPIALAQPARRRARNPSPPGGTSVADNRAAKYAVASFFADLGVNRMESERIASRAPALLSERDLTARARPVLEFLSSLGLSPKQTARALRHAPLLILRDPATFAHPLEFVRGVARLPRPRIPAAIARCPHLLWMDIDRAEEILGILRAAVPTLSDDALGGLLSRAPQVLVRDASLLRRNLEFLQERAGLADPPALARVLKRVPLALVYDVNGNLGARVKYFEALGLDTAGVGALLVATPELLMWGVDSVIRPKVEMIAGIVGDASVAHVLTKVPGVLAVDDVMDRVGWLRDAVGLNAEQIGTVVREAPAVLGYSVEGNLSPKWAFVHGTMHATVDDLVKAPRKILCANLQQRAVPRYAFLASKGIENVPVVKILQGSDADFCKNVAECDHALYRKYVDNDTYLLFFSQLL